MNKTNLLTKLVSLAAFIALVAYIGAYFIGSLLDSTQTSPAIMATVADSARTEGLIIRAEIIMTVLAPRPRLPVIDEENIRRESWHEGSTRHWGNML